MCESQVEDLDRNIDNRLPLETPATTVVYFASLYGTVLDGRQRWCLAVHGSGWARAAEWTSREVRSWETGKSMRSRRPKRPGRPGDGIHGW